ncbi:hypothetical protein BY996DRAFT_6429551 [Phakopsora pachyrhizi]|nr:hypothetical protein BY996DRAFT_6429551 [Phakopsora pachyrhizi]
MARIKRTWKKAPETNPKVVVLIKKFQELPDNELTVALEEAISVGWQWPRSDLMFWIPVLNRFDAYLETTVKNYDLRGPGSKKEKDADGKEIKEDDTNRIGVQINEFTPMTKRMTLAIFGFVKLLLENCTNRKLFCSYDRLNDFLLTTDTDVLLANLRLILRSAQQWSAQHQDMNGGFGISHTRLLDLLQSWSSIGGARSASLSLVDVVRKAVPSSQQLNDSPMDTGQPRFPQAAFMPEVVFQFYRKADTKPISHERSEANMGIKPSIDEKRKSKEFNTSTPAASSQTAASASVSNPMTTPKSRQKDRHTGTVTSPTQPNSTAIEGLAAIHVPSSTIAAATLPQDLLADLVDENALPLECRFKLFHRNRDQIIQMAVVRLLALAIYTHTTDEATAMSKLFIYEPGLISQLSELINLEIDDGSIAGDIQAAAFYALEGISRYRGKIAEVAGAVGVSVIIRRLAKELEKEQCRCTDDCLQLMGAGIVPVLVEICKSSHRKHMSTVTRAVTNLDAFGLFNQADGLKVFVNRIKEECSTDDPSAIKSSELLIGMLPHSSAGLLKALFRSIQRLLTVRNLTETQLPAAIKLIIQNNMMSTLIHSEPTSLVILQEAGLPEALYDAIDEGIEPAFDVIAAIPSALGALCLNEVGLRQLNSRKAIQAIFSVFTREKHARILRDRDHATLIRHQPSLKKTVLEATNIDPSAASLSRVLLKSEPKEIEQTKDVNDSQATLHHTQVISNDVIMSEPVAGPSIISQQPQLDAANKKEKDEKDAYLNNVVLLYIDVACRLLESMLQNVAHCQDFISMQGLDILLSLLRLPSIPYNFSITTAAEAFASTIRVLTETLPRETLLVVMKQLRSDLVDIRPFWETLRPQAMMLDMISPPPEKLDEYNFTFRRLISIQAYISFLSDICVASGYAHTRAASGILSVFTRPEESDTISYLGALQRVVFWEHILVKANAPKPWPESTGTAAINAASGVDSSSATLLIPMASMVGNEMESDASITANLTGQVSSSVSMTLSDVSNNSTVKLAESVPVTTHSETTFENTRGLRTIAAAISQSSGPLFSAMIKLLSSRRTQDDALKKQALETAAMLAQVLIGHLVWPGGEDPFSNFAYLTICLNTATQILTEVRGSRTTLNSLILSPFYNAKGLETILSLFGRYVDQADQFCKVENRNPSQNVLLVHLYGGLKVALDLLQNLCSSAALLESPHTALLQNWRDIVDPPFDAPALLISMRAMILTEISPLWKAEWLTLSPPNVVRGVVKILLDIIKAEGESLMEQPSDGSVSTTVGALMGATNTSLDRMAGVLSGVGPLSGPGYISTYPPIPGGRPSVVPDETRVASLVDMGFPRSVCETALSRTQNNLNLATEFLLASPVLVQRARDEESARSQTNAGTTGLPAEDTSPISVEPIDPGTNEENETSSNPPIESTPDELMRTSNDVLGTGDSLSTTLSSVDIMGDVESSTHDEAPEKLSPRLGPKSTGPDEIRSRMISYFLKPFDLKAAFKAFENKPFILDDNKPFDGILSLINDLQELVHDEQTVRSGTLSSHPPALSVRLRASLQRHAAALFALIINDSLEASLIPPWLASALLPASELTNSQPMPEEIEENDEDKDDDEDENGNDDADDRMAEAFMLYSADSINGSNMYFSASTSRSNKNTMAKDLMPMEPPEKDLDLLFHICTNLLRCRMCGRHDFLAAIRKHSVAEAFLSSGTESRGCLPYAAMLLRHTVESSAEIVHFVTSHSRHRQADLPSFYWKTLMDCISGVCGSWIIGLVEEKDQNNPDIPSREMEDTTPEKPFEDVSWKPANCLSPPETRIIRPPLFSQASNIAAISGTEPSDSTVTDKGDEQQLLASYNDLHHRKAHSLSQLSSEAKSKHEILNFMLCDLIPTGPLTIASWAIMVLPSEIVTSDAIVSEEPVDARYGRLYALSDLTFRLLTAAPFAQRLSANPNLNFPSHLTKVTGDSIGGAASAVEVETGDEEMAAEDEDAPDLYRNSALGLYEEDQFDDEDADMDDLDEGAMLGNGDVIAEIGHHDDEDDDDDEDEDEDEDDEDGDNDEDDEDEDDDDDEDDDNHADHDVHNADLEMEIADRVGGSIGLPEALGNSNTMDEDTRTLMSFLNSGPPDLGLQAGTSQILQATREGADIEDALEDDEGVSIADQPNAVDDVFEGGSIDFGDDVVVDHGGGENRAEAAPWSWNGVLPFQPRGEIQTAAGGMGSHHSLLHQATDNVFGRTRGGQQNAGISTHPLLVEDSTAPTRGDGLNRSQRRMDIRSGSVDQWINAIENLLGGGAGQLIEQILGNVAYGQRPIHIDLGQGPNGPSLGGVVIDPQRGVVMPVGPQGLQAPISQTTPTSRLDRHLADRVAGQTLMPLATLPRWSEEARVFHQTTSASENPTKIQRAVLALLVPRAKKIAKEEVIEKDKQAKLAHEKRSISEQRTESSTTATENLPDDGALSATQGLDTENMEEAASSGLTLLPPELPDPNSDSTATRAPTEDSEMHDGTAESGTAINESTMQDNGVQDDVAEVMNLARQLAARIGGSAEGQSDSSQTGSEAHSNSQSHVQAGTDNQTTPAVNPSLQQNSTDDAPIAASSSNVEIVAEGTSSNAAPERVTIMISGAEVDITDTGIDPTFLEALPDDMREEVLNQHFREQRPAREELSVPVPSSISTDFLDALPPEIRAEVIRSEVAAEERRRREEDLERRNTTSGSATRALSASADLDPATFLASLDPTLREAVLLDQDEGFISTLPRNILAEVDALRDRMSRRHHAIRSARERDPLGGLATTSGASQIGTSSKKTLVKADTVQVLDRSGIAALVRLMFFPQPLRRHSLQKVLVNLCENSRSRTELIGTLLGLLQDGTRDAATIDRSFSQVSSRAIKALVPPTPKSTGKLRREAHIGPLPQFPGESVPNLIALRCLEALSLLVTANDRVPIYFLTEQEVPVVLHKRSAKKGKGKEKSNTSVTYPLVGLLALLDRDSLLKQPNLTESITSLLALISRPLTALAKKLEDTKPQASGTSSLGALFLSVPEDSTNPDSSSLSLNPSGGPMTSGNASQGPVSKKTEAPSNVLEKAPILAPNDLRMIVNVLDSGECSSKTFSHTVTFIQALSTAPHGREVIAAELLERAQFLGEALLPDLDELAGAIKEAPNAAEFSSASAQQAKLLRILKTTEFLDSHLPLPDPTSPLTMTSNDLFSPSAPKIRFRPLWEKLSHCLTLIQERDDMIHIATVLLPLMESFLVVCKHSHRGTQSPRIEDASLDVMTRFFLKVLNTMVRNNPGLMIHNPKRNYFSQQLHKARSREQHGNVQLNVRRPHVFEDSFHNELKYGKLSVRFYDEEGVDAVKQIAADSKTYQPNRASSVNPDHLGFFTFCGRVIGKALYDGRVVDAYFTLAFYKHLLGVGVGLSDLESVDPDHHRSLKWMLENDIDEIFELTFSVEADDFGSTRIVDLKPDGRNIPVTNENKAEYVQLLVQNRLTVSIQEQIDAFKKGFDEIIPRDLVRIFSATELQLLLNGLPDINVEDWRANTELHQFQQSDSTVTWFWRAVRSFDQEERAKLLQFATGSSRVPLEGFGALQGAQGATKFSLVNAHTKNILPSAHTCFNQIDLPSYNSYEDLRKMLLIAISEGSEGFGE